ncbi:MAG TPA: hypothetical protein PKJ52_10125, partial [Rectinema sp.]|nr:hypothetical protein [Rectinema sp.]
VKLNLANQNAKLTDIFHAVASDKLTGQGERGAETRNMLSNVYHGSGAFFDRFDVQFVGTGEGAQAFGWGIYVTEREGVARDYAKRLGTSRMGLTIDGAYMQDLTTEEIKKSIKWDTTSIEDDELRDTIESVFLSNIEREAHNAYSKYGNDKMGLRNYMRIGLSYAKTALKRISDCRYLFHEDYNEDKINKLADSLSDIFENGLESGLIKYGVQRGRNLYTVDVWGDRQEDVLEWDGEVSDEQRKKIQQQFQNEFNDGGDFDYAKTGKEVYFAVSQGLQYYGGKEYKHAGDKQASEFLLRAGIDGIKYPVNAMSGGKGEKGYNYVVFDADQIQIKDHTRYK